MPNKGQFGEIIKLGREEMIKCGDNIKLISELENESIDLIYMDPPFNTGNDFGEYNDKWDGSENYLKFITDRLVLLKQKLKQTGSIYVHLDQRESHYVKMVMDRVFGRNSFVNEIIWSYVTGGLPNNAFGRKHDVIFLYTKTNNYTFNLQKERKRGAENIKSEKLMKDEKGEYVWYIRPNTNPKVPKGVKSYLDGHITDVWQMPFINNMAKERVGYPTQKPLKLLERIIKASSNPGDVVLDPFMGSGTTLVAAAKLNRKYIGFDINPKAIEITKKRLSEIDVPVDKNIFSKNTEKQ